MITWGEPEPPWDQQIEVMEAPRILRTTIDSVPNTVPYLDISATPLIGKYDGKRLLRVGIVWVSSRYNSARSVPLDCMAGLFTVSGSFFF